MSPALKHLCNQCCPRRSTSPLSQGNSHPAIAAFLKAILRKLRIYEQFVAFLPFEKCFFELTHFLNPASDDSVKGRMTRQHCRHSNWMVRKNTKQVKIKTTTLILRQGDLSTTSCQYWVAKPMRAQQEEKRATHLQLSALQHGGGGEIICGELDGGKYMSA